jgi:double zinc ribbon protein
MSEGERRCPNCQALVTPEAEWCGQCFTSLRAPEPAPVAGGVQSIRVVAAEGAPGDATAKLVMWPCPACDTENPIESNVCSVCGTPFGDLFRRDEAPPKIDPKEAFRRSLAFPGLGHRAIGRGGEGLARAILFLMCFAIALVAAVSGVGTVAIAAVAGLFGMLGLLVYLGTAYEASKMAAGAPPLLSSRAIVWIVGGLLMAAVFTLTILITIAARSPATQ